MIVTQVSESAVLIGSTATRSVNVKGSNEEKAS